MDAAVCIFDFYRRNLEIACGRRSPLRICLPHLFVLHPQNGGIVGIPRRFRPMEKENLNCKKLDIVWASTTQDYMKKEFYIVCFMSSAAVYAVSSAFAAQTLSLIHI